MISWSPVMPCVFPTKPRTNPGKEYSYHLSSYIVLTLFLRYSKALPQRIDCLPFSVHYSFSGRGQAADQGTNISSNSSGLCPKSSDRGVAKTVYKFGRHNANSCAPSKQSRVVRHSCFHMQTCSLQSSFSVRWEWRGFLHCVGTRDALSIWEEMKTI